MSEKNLGAIRYAAVKLFDVVSVATDEIYLRAEDLSALLGTLIHRPT